MNTIRNQGRRQFFSAAGAALTATAHAAAGDRPNILYIMTDQQHWNMMSCMGNPWVKTPAMDSIAANGVRFDLAYSSNPVCMPARTSMMSGRYPSHFEMRTNGPAEVPESALPAMLGNVFRKAGYRTAFGGKTHWPQPMTPESIGFDYITRDERDELANRAAAFLREKHTQPFLLVASFINPHDICYMAIDAYTNANKLPGMHPKSVVERQCMAEALVTPTGVSKEDFFARLCPPMPSNHGPTSNEPTALGKFGGFRGYVRTHWKEADWRMHRWAYCRLTERVDAEIGQVLAALRETGLDRNTVIVFSSDHGDMDAAHGFEHKSLPYDESARVPFLVSWQGKTRARLDKRHLISSCVDLMPTLCDYAGITPPAGLPGRSVRPLVETGKAANWREEVAIECGNSRSIRSRRYKYSLFEGREPREMLVDMDKDPGEMTNLAGDAKFAGVLADHRRRFKAHVEQLGDRYGRGLLA
ncbi:MAG: sulfatase [Acidobacteria bacterium]|nr:sulfatase [Acidobacteriota bacterium]